MKIVIIGAGPGGYVCVIRAAQLGAEVHLVEKEHVGGTCLNIGCIPTKTLLHAADTLSLIREGHGITAENIGVDWCGRLQAHNRAIVKRLVKGVSGLLRANNVSVHRGKAALLDANTVILDSGEKIDADAIVLATGSKTSIIPFAGHDLPDVIDSTEALNLPDIPKRLVILGGGVIGCEFAYLYRAMGAKVSIIEMMPQILPTIDEQIAARMRIALEAQGVEIYTDAKLERAVLENGALNVYCHVDNAVNSIACDKLLVSIGRKPNTDGLNLESLGVKTAKGAIVINEYFESSVPAIFAVGDCNVQLMLAHAASAQGEMVAARLMGEDAYYNPHGVPSCIYTRPQIAAVGYTEKTAKACGMRYRTGLFPLAANAKAIVDGSEDGLVKVLIDESDQIIGAHIIGNGAAI